MAIEFVVLILYVVSLVAAVPVVRTVLMVRVFQDRIKWVRIEGDRFFMGSNYGDSDEKPVHRVTVPTFEMSKTQVTVDQYIACVDAGSCSALVPNMLTGSNLIVVLILLIALIGIKPKPLRAGQALVYLVRRNICRP